MTQGSNFEEARANLIDAIELWITVGLVEGENMPVVNDCEMACVSKVFKEKVSVQVVYKKRRNGEDGETEKSLIYFNAK